MMTLCYIYIYLCVSVFVYIFKKGKIRALEGIQYSTTLYTSGNGEEFSFIKMTSQEEGEERRVKKFDNESNKV